MNYDDIRKLVALALGEASMCWNPPPGDQVFDSERAIAILDRVMARLCPIEQKERMSMRFEFSSQPDSTDPDLMQEADALRAFADYYVALSPAARAAEDRKRWAWRNRMERTARCLKRK